MSIIIEVADAVKTLIAEAELSIKPMVRRAYKPVYDLKDRQGLLVTVIPSAVEITHATRGRDQYDVTIDVGIQKRFEKGDNAELDPLMAVVEEIIDQFKRKTFFDSPFAVGIKVNNAPIFHPDHIDQKRMFTSLVSLSFRLLR